MTEPNVNRYEKFSRRTGSIIAHHRMWKADDHLLLVREVGCTEEYKRFFFSDIQAVVIARSSVYLLWAVLLPVLGLFCVAFIASVENYYFFAGLLAILMIFWGIHLMRGPTCKCWLQTSINKEVLPMYNRVSAANKFWKSIEPCLSQAQGRFSLEEMEAEGTRKVVDPKKTPPAVQSMSEPEAV